MTEQTKDDWPVGVLTLLGLCEALAKNQTLQSVCSDGNSSVQAVARDLALTVMDYFKSAAHGEEALKLEEGK